MHRALIGLALALMASSAMAQTTQTGSVVVQGQTVAPTPTTQFNQACNGGAGGIVGQLGTSSPYLATVCGSPGGSNAVIDYSGRMTPTTSAAQLSSLITWSGATPSSLSHGLLCSIISGSGVISYGDTSGVTVSAGYPTSQSAPYPTPHWAAAVSSLNEYVISSDGATVVACHGN